MTRSYTATTRSIQRCERRIALEKPTNARRRVKLSGGSPGWGPNWKHDYHSIYKSSVLLNSSAFFAVLSSAENSPRHAGVEYGGGENWGHTHRTRTHINPTIKPVLQYMKNYSDMFKSKEKKRKKLEEWAVWGQKIRKKREKQGRASWSLQFLVRECHTSRTN